MAAGDRGVGRCGGRDAQWLRFRGRESGRTQPVGVRPVRDTDGVRLSLGSFSSVVHTGHTGHAVRWW
ncbi:hypothetical protein ACOT81_22040 [Streptomyces sp. WI04-05B]|uniref:hypothetical protein n=1 Tax=Streptomyces TaxID=1883 RepID=UPI0029A911CE|nr:MULTISPECIES: hypothetical protein [unclassified Streptomyces]MDX2543244.1 hypothetical protein [Streptomyces sp. WI04-05B]MDX2584715.1 hypothetical protein [Streptomyces sp. WI04-05A]MDX3752778.1 hypothetical protein [Streptomyces sp. AK08-02]